MRVGEGQIGLLGDQKPYFCPSECSLAASALDGQPQPELPCEATFWLAQRTAVVLDCHRTGHPHPYGSLNWTIAKALDQAGAKVWIGASELGQLDQPGWMDILCINAQLNPPSMLGILLRSAIPWMNSASSILVLLQEDDLPSESLVRYLAQNLKTQQIRINAIVSPIPTSQRGIDELTQCTQFFTCDASRRLTGQVVRMHSRLLLRELSAVF